MPLRHTESTTLRATRPSRTRGRAAAVAGRWLNRSGASVGSLGMIRLDSRVTAAAGLRAIARDDLTPI